MAFVVRHLAETPTAALGLVRQADEVVKRAELQFDFQMRDSIERTAKFNGSTSLDLRMEKYNEYYKYDTKHAVVFCKFT